MNKCWACRMVSPFSFAYCINFFDVHTITRTSRKSQFPQSIWCIYADNKSVVDT